ncbi:hypothetical protein G6F22_017698 [Rhizopus arrhizus]|nr:hypothetical protein G6F22_017698 [Rhizopus arrhizus]
MNITTLGASGIECETVGLGTWAMGGWMWGGGDDAAAIDAIRASRANPQVFGTPTISDGMSMGTEGMKYSLVSREVIADCIETAAQGQWMDGVVVIGGCDKNMPGGMIALARTNVPGIYVYGGTIKPGHYKGNDLTIVSVFEAAPVAACTRPTR